MIYAIYVWRKVNDPLFRHEITITASNELICETCSVPALIADAVVFCADSHLGTLLIDNHDMIGRRE